MSNDPRDAAALAEGDPAADRFSSLIAAIIKPHDAAGLEREALARLAQAQEELLEARTRRPGGRAAAGARRPRRG